MRTWDVLVAGAGPAGAVAATLLARSGRSTVLVDRPAPDGPKIGECLPDVGARLLRRFALATPIDGGPHDRISGVCSLWGDEESTQDALTDPGGGGWRLDRPRFDRELRMAAVKAGAVSIADHATGIARVESAWRIDVANGAPLVAKTVIDATGRRAALARRIGARQHADQALVAVWSTGASLPTAYNTRTFIETTAEGWWYGAVLPGGRPLAAFHCAPALATTLATNPGRWRSRLNDTRLVGSAVEASRFEGRRLARADARGLVLDVACGPGWYACGDAALSFNPLASQGISNAIATAAMAAKSIVGQDPDAATAYQVRINEIRRAYRLRLDELERRRRPFVANDARRSRSGRQG